MLPGLAVIPAVVPRTTLRPIFAELVDDRSAADNRLEAVGFALGKAGHLAAIAIAHQRQLVRIDGKLLQYSVHTRHNVAEIAPSQVILVGRRKLRPVSARTAR